jgi:large subunit ribosomal protein L10
MALTRTQKAAQISDLTEKFKKAESVIFSHYIGLKVGEVSELRKKLRQAGAEMKVAKKTLMQLASKEAGLPEVQSETLAGPVACIFSFTDPIVGAQVAFAFSKDHPQVTFIGGVFEGKILSEQQAKALATIPGRTVLLATFAGMIRSPLVSFASMCNGPLTGFARALGEVAKKKSAEPLSS